MMAAEEVVIMSDEIRWDVHAKEVGSGEDKAIELSWGWTAGWSDAEIAELADDSPRGSESVLMTHVAAGQLAYDLMQLLGGE